MGSKQRWSQRFNRHVCETWRRLQAALADGDSIAVRNFLGTLHMALGIGVDCPLPIRELHRASFPTRSSRPEMIAPPVASQERAPAACESFRLIEEPVQPKAIPAPSVAPLTDTALIDLYREVQQDLARRHMPFALKASAVVDLERELVRALDLDPLDRDGVEAMMHELHLRAFDDPRTRPDRIILDVPDGSPLEDY